MTRIRRNWSSSRGAEELEPPSTLVADTNDADMEIAGKPVSPFSMDLVDEDAVLAAVSLKSLEHGADMHNVEHESASAGLWDRSVLVGDGKSKQARFESRSLKISSPLVSDRDPELLPNTKASTPQEIVDEHEAKSSAADRKVNSDMACGWERANRVFSIGKPKVVHGLRPLSVFKRKTGKDYPPCDDYLPLEGKTGRTKRQKPWESDSDFGVTDVDGYRDASKTQKTDVSVSGEKIAEGDSYKLRTKSQKVTDDHVSGARNKVAAKYKKEGKDAGDRIKRTKTETTGIDVEDMNKQRNMPGKVETSGERNDLGAKSDSKVGTDFATINKRRAEKVGSDVGNRYKGRAKIVGTETCDRNKPSTKSEGIDSGASGGVADIFPAGWAYRGLAQIAEKDKAAHGQGKQQCGRTDGREWRCPLKVQEGFSLCEHHLNKSRLKKMGKSLGKGNHRTNSQKANLAVVSPQTSDSTFQPPTPRDYDTDARTKFRRKHKTVKLSVL